ncbi:transposase [Roseovarius nanhaiticus]|uniref:Transposase n=1 Tax=Roseovarius nanhaiticus TaxID=573024 RepID=A0A1N7HBD7_9RHOB|nr:hypothetical protein [Roseovarius nanhaiticus]SEL04717.1 transposase [Roseovarius nanhaiticus]SIS22176.1 transposase [Roseovarius nanhaiticus]
MDKRGKDIRHKTREVCSAKAKIFGLLAGLSREQRVSVLCRREGIAESLYYRGPNEFLDAGNRRLAGDAARWVTSPDVTDLRPDTSDLKERVADLTLENCLLKLA